jgi:hypothetical protein
MIHVRSRRDLVFCLVTLAACLALWRWEPFPVKHASHHAPSVIAVVWKPRTTAMCGSI